VQILAYVVDTATDQANPEPLQSTEKCYLLQVDIYERQVLGECERCGGFGRRKGGGSGCGTRSWHWKLGATTYVIPMVHRNLDPLRQWRIGTATAQPAFITSRRLRLTTRTMRLRIPCHGHQVDSKGASGRHQEEEDGPGRGAAHLGGQCLPPSCGAPKTWRVDAGRTSFHSRVDVLVRCPCVRVSPSFT
jgi:hypothetical protein